MVAELDAQPWGSWILTWCSRDRNSNHWIQCGICRIQRHQFHSLSCLWSRQVSPDVATWLCWNQWIEFCCRKHLMFCLIQNFCHDHTCQHFKVINRFDQNNYHLFKQRNNEFTFTELDGSGVWGLMVAELDGSGVWHTKQIKHAEQVCKDLWWYVQIVWQLGR